MTIARRRRVGKAMAGQRCRNRAAIERETRRAPSVRTRGPKGRAPGDVLSWTGGRSGGSVRSAYTSARGAPDGSARPSHPVALYVDRPCRVRLVVRRRQRPRRHVDNRRHEPATGGHHGARGHQHANRHGHSARRHVHDAPGLIHAACRHVHAAPGHGDATSGHINATCGHGDATPGHVHATPGHVDESCGPVHQR